jgi:hypothetical protein
MKRKKISNLGKWLTRWNGYNDLKVKGLIGPAVHIRLNAKLDGWICWKPCPWRIFLINFVSFLTNL